MYGILDPGGPNSKNCQNPAESVADGFRRQGPAFLTQLNGAFLLCVEDFTAACAWLCSDVMGQMGLYYHLQGNTLAVAEQPANLLQRAGGAINRSRVEDFFARSDTLDDASYFHHIAQLKPGQCLHVTDRLQTRTLHQWPTEVQRPAADDADVASRFQALLQEAIAVQCAGQARIGAMMSGGLDSTLVTALACRSGPQVHTFSYVFGQDRQADESIWIEAMRALPIRSNTFNGDAYWPLKEPWPTSLNAPVANPYRHLKNTVYAMAEAREIKVMLTGVFADHLYTGWVDWFSDLLRQKPIQAIRSLYRHSRTQGLKWVLKTLYRAMRGESEPALSWLTEGVRRAHLERRRVRHVTHPHRQQFVLNTQLSTAESAHLEHEFSAPHGLILRHPFRHRPLVEYALQLPAWQLGDPADRKRLARTLAQHHLPVAVQRRRQISTLTGVFMRGVLQHEIDFTRRLLGDSACDWFDYVRADALHAVLKDPGAAQPEKNLLLLWQCLSYEMWKAAVAARPATPAADSSVPED